MDKTTKPSKDGIKTVDVNGHAIHYSWISVIACIEFVVWVLFHL
jgi:hypothetical protein